MYFREGFLAATAFFFVSSSAGAQAPAADENQKVALSVPAGAPLRLYLTGRLSKHIGAPAQAKVMEPVFAFDREVIPAGTIALGRVSQTQPLGKWQRFRAILNGDFTPLRKGLVEFTTLKLADGQELATHTVMTTGLRTLYNERAKKNPPPQPQAQNGGLLGTAKQTAKERIHQAMDQARVFGDTVRGPNKKEKLVDFLWSKAPYHPQYWRRGTRFDAPLSDPLAFGWASVKPEDLAALGTQPAPDTVAHVRLLTELNSGTAKQGETVEALISAPVFSSEHKLVLPEGTRLTGEVVLARRARLFHRSGRLRFNFQNIELPEAVAKLQSLPAARPAMRTQAILAAAESGAGAPIKVDGEGGVQAKESKTRFLAPAISLMIASRAADNDAGRNHGAGGAGNADGNVSGRTLGGGLGLGMAGAAISQTSPYVGMAFGYYGLAWSVYSHIVARGGEVQFDKNTMMDIKFGARPPASHFLPSAAGGN